MEENVRVPSELRALRYKNGWVNKDSSQWTEYIGIYLCNNRNALGLYTMSVYKL